ncbi:MAG: hypothetical protein ACP5IL_10185 [Syntrophobacteraceae bacterium]
MRYLIVVLSFWALVCGTSAAQSPPFSQITISGRVYGPYNRVSLFESGESTTPLKTVDISPTTREYSIVVNIPDDMRNYQNMLFTDMRFWNDPNYDGVLKPTDQVSRCHFVEWHPGSGKLYLQVYGGPRYRIESENFTYDSGEKPSPGLNEMIGNFGGLINKSTVTLAVIGLSGLMLIKIFKNFC